jgi:CheY-like chemotaxis protein
MVRNSTLPINFSLWEKTLTKLSVLVVDDHPVVRFGAAALLKEGGYDVQLAENSEVAKERLAAGGIVGVICDNDMNRRGEGLLFLDWVRKHPDFKNLPFILHTLHTPVPGENLEERLGALNGVYCAKGTDNLLEATNQLLGIHN